ncbi:hypothetical protein WI80_00405 [Burkholderia ubonensis]|uniref:hypothetical protein n=1 Tax=Burkholderia ubonensis TaxID=101571 RepID=UPI00075EEF18|nr:hypothetical protein [Burkholderia ubonensis]KVD16129.1 hypothetical protein WI80_00405 [Burkholderia ubonensis]KVU24997.1 hypothetical protein WK63_25695 [Burkholderia ubonensis]
MEATIVTTYFLNGHVYAMDENETILEAVDLLAVITDFYGVQLHEQLREQRTSRPGIRTRKPDPPF